MGICRLLASHFFPGVDMLLSRAIFFKALSPNALMAVVAM